MARASPTRSRFSTVIPAISPGAPASMCCPSAPPRTARSPPRRWCSSIRRWCATSSCAASAPGTCCPSHATSRRNSWPTSKRTCGSAMRSAPMPWRSRSGRAAGARLLHPVEANEVFVMLGRRRQGGAAQERLRVLRLGGGELRRGAFRRVLGPARGRCTRVVRGAQAPLIVAAIARAGWSSRAGAPRAAPAGIPRSCRSRRR